MMSEAERAPFRHQHCLTAFSVLPASADADASRWLDAIAASNFESLLHDAWRKGGEQSAEKGHRSDLPAEGLAASAARIAGRPCAMVTLPKPFSPPEAYFAAVFPSGFSEGDHNQDRSPVVYTLEMTDPLERTPPVVGRLDAKGMHALVGSCGASTVAAFQGALEAIARGATLPQDGTPLRQLLLYARLGQ
jgi:hypothetical protein